MFLFPLLWKVMVINFNPGTVWNNLLQTLEPHFLHHLMNSCIKSRSSGSCIRSFMFSSVIIKKNALRGLGGDVCSWNVLSHWWIRGAFLSAPLLIQSLWKPAFLRENQPEIIAQRSPCYVSAMHVSYTNTCTGCTAYMRVWVWDEVDILSW